jgi:hypothetical protein
MFTPKCTSFSTYPSDSLFYIFHHFTELTYSCKHMYICMYLYMYICEYVAHYNPYNYTVHKLHISIDIPQLHVIIVVQFCPLSHQLF